MKLLKEFKDSNFPTQDYDIKTREAVRIVLVDEQGLTPLIYASTTDHYKIPGGGVDEGESIEKALEREALEEAGCKIKILGEVGKIIETRSVKTYGIKRNIHQTSFGYFGKITKKLKHDFTDSELKKGYELRWLNINDAISHFTSVEPKNPGGILENVRDGMLFKLGYEELKKHLS